MVDQRSKIRHAPPRGWAKYSALTMRKDRKAFEFYLQRSSSENGARFLPWSLVFAFALHTATAEVPLISSVLT